MKPYDGKHRAADSLGAWCRDALPAQAFVESDGGVVLFEAPDACCLVAHLPQRHEGRLQQLPADAAARLRRMGALYERLPKPAL